MSIIAASSIAQSMYWPRPVRSRWNSADETAKAALRPLA